MSSPISHGISPFQCPFKKPPDYLLLRIFGCLCFLYLCPYNSNKMQYQLSPCVFLGYSNKHHRYRCLDHAPTKLILLGTFGLMSYIFFFLNPNSAYHLFLLPILLHLSMLDNHLPYFRYLLRNLS